MSSGLGGASYAIQKLLSDMTDLTESQLPLAESGKAAGAKTAPTRPRWLSPRCGAVPALAALALGILLGAYVGPALQRATSIPTDPAASAVSSEDTAEGKTAVNTVGALGRLMPEGDTTTLALPFGAGDARVAHLLIGEGQRVAAGHVIAELDNLPQRQASRAIALAQLEAKRAELAQARSEARQGWAEAQAASSRAYAARLSATQDLARISALVPSGVTTQAQLDQARAVTNQAAADQEKAAAAMQRYSHRDTDSQPDVQLALGNLHAAQATLAQAEQDLASAHVTASLKGTVIAIHVRAGEKPGERGIATLGDVDHMAAELEVYQTDIRRVVVGQRVVLASTSLEEPLTGTVTQIGMEVQRQAVLSSDPVSNIDARVIKVKVALDPRSSERARALTGLQVTAKIVVVAP